MSMPERPVPTAMMSGFGNHFSSEAVPGALPIGRNSPQKVPFGLYAEQLSGTAFTAPRHENRRSWLYRLRPSAAHPPYSPYGDAANGNGQRVDPPSPNRLRWDPMPLPSGQIDFVDGMVPWLVNGDASAGTGCTVYLYAITAGMSERAFFSADGEMLIVPQQGRLRIDTEFGAMTLEPLQIGLVPRGVRMRVEPLDGSARGYVCENHGSPLRLPELGPIGANGLANPRDFETPVAAFEDVDRPTRIVQKYCGKLWQTDQDHSPFDVVAWHGNLCPVRYDLRRFNTINTVSYDHPDPSIFTVLTSPGDSAGTANLDFVIFPPRWMVAEESFRPPWFHRNIMSECMGLIHGAYDAKAGGFSPGGLSLHNCMSAHGPDQASYERAVEATLAPHKIEDTMAFMFECRLPFVPTSEAQKSSLLQGDYDRCWDGLRKAALPEFGEEGA